MNGLKILIQKNILPALPEDRSMIAASILEARF
jgi:hypothetical protein